jgi:hypothetical protein
MSEEPCCHCGEFFPSSPRHKNQRFCGKPECQRARKAAWQRHKIQTDSDYRFNQKLSRKQWNKNHPDYWKQYRKQHPDKAERNRILQSIRNRRARSSPSNNNTVPSLIAKMDASKPEALKMLGQFWIVPVIAKMDALKVNILKIPVHYS